MRSESAFSSPFFWRGSPNNLTDPSWICKKPRLLVVSQLKIASCPAAQDLCSGLGFLGMFLSELLPPQRVHAAWFQWRTLKVDNGSLVSTAPRLQGLPAIGSSLAHERQHRQGPRQGLRCTGNTSRYFPQVTPLGQVARGAHDCYLAGSCQ